MTKANPSSMRESPLTETLEAFGDGARLLEDAYRELWVARERERGEREVSASERIRDLCHEISNPLGGVRGLAALLARELAAVPSSPRAERLLSKLQNGLETVQGILETQTHDEGSRADAARIAEEIVGLALAENRANGGTTHFRVESADGIELPVTAHAFRQALTNLVRNAAQACEGRGTVTVSLRSSLHGVVAFVEDDGIGLPRVSDADLFRRGFSTKGSGRGSGLAVTSEIVANAGGALTFCRLARGTLARIRFPRGR